MSGTDLSAAREAFRAGNQAAEAGDLSAARFWLERARRLTPQDGSIRLALAALMLRQGAPQAVALLEQVAGEDDVREAWMGLIAARHSRQDAPGAAAAMAALLQRHALAPGLAARLGFGHTLDLVAAQAGAPGWCGLGSDGRLAVHALRPGLALEATLDPPRGKAGRSGPSGPVRRRQVLALPPGWQAARAVRVTLDGKDLLGSPVAIATIRRVEGFVTARDGGLAGWAWSPNDPDADPVLDIQAGNGRRLQVLAADQDEAIAHPRPLARPRGFFVPADQLAGLAGALHVRGHDGRDLYGSPLDPAAERHSVAAAAAAIARAYPVGRRREPGIAAPIILPAVPADLVGPQPPGGARRRRVAVVVPVYRGLAVTGACLDLLLASLPRWARVVVVDDASPEPELAALLDRLAARGTISLLRHASNRGFPAAANSGLRFDPDRDAVLLNSDTLVPPSWLERLREAAYADPATGTATPLSNDATILSYPSVTQVNPIPDAAATHRLDALAARVNRGQVVEIPTAVGFCTYIKRDCLAATGLLREDVFAQGYGEENDFCLRARHLGWRHVAATDVFVGHVGGQSFGAAKRFLIDRNLAILERLHPGYAALIAAFQARDPLLEARRRLDLARLRAARPATGEAVLLITHDRGGGVRRRVAEREAALREAGLRPLVLRPAGAAVGPGAGETDGGDAAFDAPWAGPGEAMAASGRGPAPLQGPRAARDEPDVPEAFCVLEAGIDAPNLRFAWPRERAALARLLTAERVGRAEVHHLIGHDHALLGLLGRLGIPYEMIVHDYALFCPRINLVGAERRYCGEPDLAGCEACIADAGSALDETIGVAALRARSAAALAGATRVIVPSADVARRIARHFPPVDPVVSPWEDDRAILAGAALPPAGPVQDGPTRGGRVCVVGAIGIEKGFEVLLALGRDAAERALPLEFVLVGHSCDDARLLATGRVLVTGPYRPDEAVALIRAQGAALALLPSIWPETWCYALSEAWAAGLEVAAFDLGAPAERIRRTGRGWLLPLGLPPAAVNQRLLDLLRTRHARPG